MAGSFRLLGERDEVKTSPEVERALRRLAEVGARVTSEASPVSQDDNPGQLKRSWGFDSEPGRAAVYSTDPKVAHVELGTKDTPAANMLRGPGVDAMRAAAR